MREEITELKSQGKLKRVLASIGGGDNQTYHGDLSVDPKIAAQNAFKFM